jgi:hypothetical protein
MVVFRIDIRSLGLNLHFITVQMISMLSVMESTAIVKAKTLFAPNDKVNFAATYWFQYCGLQDGMGTPNRGGDINDKSSSMPRCRCGL